MDRTHRSSPFANEDDAMTPPHPRWFLLPLIVASLSPCRPGRPRRPRRSTSTGTSGRSSPTPNCSLCHGPDKGTRKALSRSDVPDGLAEREILVPGKPERSELVTRILSTERDRMPPVKSNLSLSLAEIDKLRRWVAEGAEYRPHWAFEPLPRRVSVPKVGDTHGAATPLDRFALARLQSAKKLAPSPAAPRGLDPPGEL